MATTSFTIYSLYDPETDKEKLKRDTGQISELDRTEDEQDNEQLWREAASAQFLRTQRPPPKFVPATISYEIGDSKPGPSNQSITQPEITLGTSLSSWYHSLTNVCNGEPSSSSVHQANSLSASIPATHRREGKVTKDAFHAQIIMDKTPWFISKALQSEPSSTTSQSPPTLTDILTREPPPLPDQPKYIPPVWIEIGPSNKGFSMLQKGGWEEGQPLGFGARRRPSFSDGTKGTIISATAKAEEKAETIETQGNRASLFGKQEFRNCLVDVRNEGADIIDLTLSDSEVSSGVEESPQRPEYPAPEDIEEAPAHGRKALLTPIATVLKLDRLGIGLKARTEGPYKASVKRVTHNATSLAIHARAAEEARRRREKFGRGRRGYERQKRREEDKRRDLLAYMNT